MNVRLAIARFFMRRRGPSGQAMSVYLWKLERENQRLKSQVLYLEETIKTMQRLKR